MRIFDARGKDYYDGVMYSTFHGDEETLFIREEKEIKGDSRKCDWNWGKWEWGNVIKEWPFGGTFSYRPFGRTEEDVEEELFYLGFCGRVYPVVRMTTYKTKIHHTIGLRERVVDKIEYIYEPLDRYSKSVKKMFESFKNPPQAFLDKWLEMMKENRSPVFIASYKTDIITWNVHLEEFQFPKIVDAWEAGKSVYQFLSNLGRIELEIPEESDVEKAERHGFDKKKSFRKEPQK